MMTLNEARQRADAAFLDSGAEFAFGRAEDCPLPVEALARLDAAAPGVQAVIESGLTARVFKLRSGPACWAVKRARAQCLVRNEDGRLSFLNELRRHAELRELALPGVITPVFGSLRAGLIVSPWTEGEHVDSFDERRLSQLFATGRALIEHGFFEWDFSAGNLLDDGRQLRLFDFGYMYRFDPLRQFNTAGHGNDHPGFHLAERIETRNVFAWLLKLEAAEGETNALKTFRRVKEVALEHYLLLRASLARRGADANVLAWLDGITGGWTIALQGDLEGLYLAEGWRSHLLDLRDDLHGQSCTPSTLRRADWLIRVAQTSFDALTLQGALFGVDQACSREDLVAARQADRARARRLLLQPIDRAEGSSGWLKPIA